MKFLVVFVSIAVTVIAATDVELWTHFKKTHNKTYKNVFDENLRFVIFQNNLRTIKEHNDRFNNGEETYYMGVNQFTDLTPEEFHSRLTFKKHDLTHVEKFEVDSNFVAPNSYDWRDYGAVLEVKDQGQCGGCWAFSATGSIEGQNAIKHNEKVSLSEQDLIDCSTAYGNEGCNGGVMEYGFEYVKAHGIATEKLYPYTATDGQCKSVGKSGVEVTGYVEVGSTESSLFNAVASVGPISVAINADLLQFYEGGIFDNRSCSNQVNHGVLVVGYGTENNTAYWIIKNSWGISWGETGYLRLIRNANEQCAIGSWNTYPKVA